MVESEILDREHWDEQYESQQPVWETGRPCDELQHVLMRQGIRPCRAIELGCGTGINAVWLATQGFVVTAVYLSQEAIGKARERATRAGTAVDFRAGDLIETCGSLQPFDFFYDRGCYHAVRLADVDGYLDALSRITRPGSVGLVLTGNADEPEDEAGPPVLEESQLRAELGRHFDIVDLRPFRWDARPGDKRYLGWSCFLRRASSVGFTDAR